MISEISKRDIIDVLTEGLYNREFFYFGRLSETKFLNRIVNLNELSSNDSRFNNMAEDIWQHTENNDDWDIDWVFYDERLNLLHNDNLFTNFIIQVFHPKNCLEGLAAGPTIAGRLGINGEKIEENNPVWDYLADYLSQAAYNTTLLLSPQVIIFGGGVMNQPNLLKKIKARFKEQMNAYVATPDLDAYILQPGLKDNAGTIGCLALAKKHFD